MYNDESASFQTIIILC